MSAYYAQIASAARATAIHSPTSFSWLGRRAPTLPPAVRRSMSATTARDYLRFQLRLQLYAGFYTAGGVPVAPPAELLRPGGGAPFVARLSAANAGRGPDEGGWVLHAIEDDRLAVRRGDLTLWVTPDACRPVSDGPLVPGDPLLVRFPKELLGLSPGFHLVLGDVPLAGESGQPLVRLYWNLAAEGAERFVEVGTRLLNQAGLAFHLKVVNDPARFTRCDAGVLYLRRHDVPAATSVLAALYGALREQLTPAVPAFTKRLAPGLGLAEDPAADSFGLQRCQLLAEGLIRAHEARATALDARVAIVEACFAEAGIDATAPYLNPGSADVYDLEIEAVERSARVSQAPIISTRDDAGSIPSVSQAAQATADAYLRTAVDIGQIITRRAIWHGRRCTWLGAVARDPGAATQPERYTTLGPELYDGTAGVAVVLAELASAADDPELRRTARGALRQALARVDDVAPALQLGLFSGWPGISLAAVRVGLLLDDDESRAAGEQLLARLAAGIAAEHELDMLSGSAGAIIALLVLHRLLGATAALDLAARLGDELLRRAVDDGHGYSWPSLALPRSRNLTGLSHGAAGIGYALLELFRATGEARYRAGAERAFAYEQHWFDARAANWPDFRGVLARVRRPSAPCAAAWCHGAPGIALTRLRAYRILNQPPYRAQALVALETTRAAVESALEAETSNYSLCHGLAGNAAILQAGRRILGQPAEPFVALVNAVAAVGIARYAARENWPCGTHGGQTPGLMLGLAGIARYYLGLANPTLPSLLLLQPEQFGD